jgi:hypothetical protein
MAPRVAVAAAAAAAAESGRLSWIRYAVTIIATYSTLNTIATTTIIILSPVCNHCVYHYHHYDY